MTTLRGATVNVEEQKTITPTVEKTFFQPLFFSDCLPPQVFQSHLKANGKLMEDDIMAVIKAKAASLPPGAKISRKTMLTWPEFERFKNLPLVNLKTTLFPCIKDINHQLHSIYWGIKHNIPNSHSFTIGSGSLGTVKLTQSFNEGTWGAIKVIKELNEKKVKPEDVETEFKFLCQTKQGLAMGTHISPDAKKGLRYNLLTVLESGENLFEHILDKERSRSLPEYEWIKLIIDVVCAIKKMHQIDHIIHCDIKPENIIHNFISKKLAVIDWGFAFSTAEMKEQSLYTIKGTPGFIAPELMRSGKVTYSEKSDIYALGITLADILSFTIPVGPEGKPTDLRISHPDEDKRFFESNKKIVHQEIRKHIVALLNKMTHEKPLQRPSLQQCLSELEEYLELSLKANPRKKIAILNADNFFNASEIKKREIIRSIPPNDEVCIIAQSEHSLAEYNLLKRTLKEKGCNLRNQIFYAPAKELETIIAEAKKIIAKEDPRIQYEVVTLKESVPTLAITATLFTISKPVQPNTTSAATHVQSEPNALPSICTLFSRNAKI